MSGDDGAAIVADGGLRETSMDELARLAPVVPSDRRQGDGRQRIADHRRRRVGVDHVRRPGASNSGCAARARIVDYAVVGDDPQLMLTANIPATRARAWNVPGSTSTSIDRFEVNEAFASAVIAWLREIGPDDPTLIDRVNVNGGAIALGHPLGASGTRLTGTSVNELERIGGRYGLQVMCEGGGMANALVVERM